MSEKANVKNPLLRSARRRYLRWDGCAIVLIVSTKGRAFVQQIFYTLFQLLYFLLNKNNGLNFSMTPKRFEIAI